MQEGHSREGVSLLHSVNIHGMGAIVLVGFIVLWVAGRN